MTIGQSLLPEFDHEMATTRRMLACVPEGKNDWKPHPKSMPLGRLAGHVAELPGWGSVTLEQTELDFAPAGAPAWEPGVFTTHEDTLRVFDDHVARARASLARSTDADFMVPWTLKSGGKTLFTMPRIAVIRGFVLSHLIHRRAQLGVYLRLNDIAIPGSYGPSADEAGF
ncbi:MAG TPA: DinB family protein [Gemmatimonadales bacterium]